MNWWEIFIDALAGSLLVQYGMWTQRRRTDKELAKRTYVVSPYRWTCAEPECNFSVECTREEGMFPVIQGHHRYHQNQKIADDQLKSL